LKCSYDEDAVLLKLRIDFTPDKKKVYIFSKEHKRNSTKTTATNDFDLTLRCIYWLNQKLVLQHVALLNAAKTPLSTGETPFGANGPRNCATSLTALTPCASKGGCCREEFAAKPSNGKQLRKN